MVNDMWSPGRRTRRWLLVGEILFALFLALLSFSVVSTHGVSWWGVAATCVLLAAFFVRRRSPRWTMALAALAGILQLVDPHGFVIFADLLYMPICATFGVSRSERTRRLGLLGAVLAAVLPAAALLPRLLHGEEHWLAVLALGLMFGAVAALVALGGWIWGYLRLQQRLRIEAAIATQLSEAERIRLEETYAQSAFRERLAGEMHDVVGHSWAVVAAQADGARYALRTSPETAEQALDTIAEVARSSITDLRDILRQLRYTETTEGQVSPEQQEELLRRMRQAGMDLRLDEIGEPADSVGLRQTAYRLLSESLTNALKHGDLSEPVRARLDWTRGLTLDVDNRVGVSSRIPGTGMGLGSMRERVRVQGGSLDARENHGHWHLHAHVPTPIPQETS